MQAARVVRAIVGLDVLPSYLSSDASRSVGVLTVLLSKCILAALVSFILFTPYLKLRQSSVSANGTHEGQG